MSSASTMDETPSYMKKTATWESKVESDKNSAVWRTSLRSYNMLPPTGKKAKTDRRKSAVKTASKQRIFQATGELWEQRLQG